MRTQCYTETHAVAMVSKDRVSDPGTMLLSKTDGEYHVARDMALSHKPQVLHLASVERIAATRRALRDNDYPLCMYLSGLAVECILQAVAFRTGASPGAHLRK